AAGTPPKQSRPRPLCAHGWPESLWSPHGNGVRGHFAFASRHPATQCDALLLPSVKCLQSGATREPSHAQDQKPLSIIGHMLFSSIKDHNTVDAGTAHDTSFPPAVARTPVG